MTLSSIDERVGHCRPDRLLTPPPRTVMIGGCARSGTTLLQHVLCSSDDVNPPVPECAPVRFAVQAYRRSLRHAAMFPETYFDNAGPAQRYATLLTSILDDMRKRFDCQKIVFKEPALTPFFSQCHDLLKDDVAFVIMVRDPRAVIASMIEWGDRAVRSGGSHWFAMRDVKQLCTFVFSYYGHFMTANLDTLDRTIYIRYEDLVSSPTQEIGRLERCLGINLGKFDPDAAWRTGRYDVSQRSIARDAFSELYGKPISKTRIDSFRSRLSIEEQCLISQSMREFNRVFGYEMVDTVLAASRLRRFLAAMRGTKAADTVKPAPWPTSTTLSRGVE